jgi:hypothetical protein
MSPIRLQARAYIGTDYLGYALVCRRFTKGDEFECNL